MESKIRDGIPFVRIRRSSLLEDIAHIESILEKSGLCGVELLAQDVGHDIGDIIDILPREISGFSAVSLFNGAFYRKITKFPELRVICLSEIERDVDLSQFKSLTYYQGPYNSTISRLKNTIRHIQVDSIPKHDVSFNDNIFEELEFLYIFKSDFLLLGPIIAKKLKYFGMTFCPNVSDISLRSESLFEMDIQKCPNLSITSNLIRQFGGLSKIILNNIKSLDSVEFVPFMSSLSTFSFPNTSILSGDLHPLMESKSLKHVFSTKIIALSHPLAK